MCEIVNNIVTPANVVIPINKTIIKTKDKVSITGFAPSWIETNWDNPEFEFWTLNEAYKLFEKANPKKNAKADRWFEIHNPESPSKNTKEHKEFLEKCPVPVYMQKHYDNIPNSMAFPFSDIMDWLKDNGHIGYKYFTNSISWIIAFALYLGFKEIHVYGVDMAQDKSKNGTSEYAYQKPSCEYILGVAEKYAKVYLPETSDLIKCHHLYGIDSDNDANVWLKKQIHVMGDRYKQINQALVQSKNATFQNEMMLAELRGANGAYEAVLKRRL